MKIKISLILFALLCCLPTMLQAQERKVQHKPFIDTRVLHYGFFVGIHDQGLSIENNGFIDEATGRQWTVENDQPNYGFHVGVLGELKLTNHLALRAIPSLYFGSKHLKFFDQSTGETQSQDMKSTYIALPLNLKISAPRWNNYRPYVVAGINPTYDLTAHKHSLLRAKPFCMMAEVGLGCDFYLPFFKLIPELKFSFGLGNLLNKKRTDLADDNTDIIYTRSVDRITPNMVSLVLYFE